MSYRKGDVLPLDASPECLNKTEVLRQIWTILSELGNQVTTFVVEPERNAGPMMLAIKCLKEGILKDEDLGKEEKATLATALRRAADWVSPFPFFIHRCSLQLGLALEMWETRHVN